LRACEENVVRRYSTSSIEREVTGHKELSNEGIHNVYFINYGDIKNMK
jgi:hypothetical protein